MPAGSLGLPQLDRRLPAFQSSDPLSTPPHTLGEIRSPKLVNWDVSFEKLTALSTGANLSLRVEVINLFNGVNWRGPRSVYGRADFGQIQGTRGFPRTLQFMVKVMF